MGVLSNILKMFKTDMSTDGNDYFDFERDLNQNWDKIDDFAKYENECGVYFDKIKDITIQIPTQTAEEISLDYYEVKKL